VGFGLLAMFFLVLKSYSLHWEVGDENIYLYMAWATLDHGALPYRDYFFAHPPLHLLPGLPVFGLLGFSPVTARLIPVGASLVSAVFVFLIGHRRFGRLGALAAVFGLLTAFSLLRASSHWTGINLAVMWSTVGLYFLFTRRAGWAGAMFALGVCTGNYVLPGAVMAGLLALLDSRRAGLRFLGGFIIPWAGVQVAGLALGGGQYIDGVYRYHFLKPDKPGVARDMFFRVSTDNFLLHLGVLLAPLLAWWDRWLARGSRVGIDPIAEPDPAVDGLLARIWFGLRRALLQDGPRGLARIGALWTLGYLLFIATLPRVFPFYFLLMFPGMALATGFLAERVVRHGIGLAGRFRQRDESWWRSAGLIAGLLAFVVLAYLVRTPLQRGLLPNYVRSRPVPMVWSDSPLPVNGLMRWCCWEETAEAYRGYGTVQEVLYHESRFFEAAEPLAEWVRRNTRPDQVLFGDSSVAGLVAVLSARRLAGDFADTNTLRFTSGVAAAGEVIAQIDRPDLAAVLVQGMPGRDRQGRTFWRYGKFASLPAFRSWLERSFQPVHQVRDRTKGVFLLLGRKP
jgi:hypothetical protein